MLQGGRFNVTIHHVSDRSNSTEPELCQRCTCCSGGGANDPANQPQASTIAPSEPGETPVTPPPQATDAANFEQAIKLTKLVFADKFGKAGDLVAGTLAFYIFKKSELGGKIDIDAKAC
jgi:hypothetical protein